MSNIICCPEESEATCSSEEGTKKDIKVLDIHKRHLLRLLVYLVVVVEEEEDGLCSLLFLPISVS